MTRAGTLRSTARRRQHSMFGLVHLGVNQPLRPHRSDRRPASRRAALAQHTEAQAVAASPRAEDRQPLTSLSAMFEHRSDFSPATLHKAVRASQAYNIALPPPTIEGQHKLPAFLHSHIRTENRPSHGCASICKYGLQSRQCKSSKIKRTHTPCCLYPAFIRLQGLTSRSHHQHEHSSPRGGFAPVSTLTRDLGRLTLGTRASARFFRRSRPAELIFAAAGPN
jgi:hypothetical protein